MQDERRDLQTSLFGLGRAAAKGACIWTIKLLLLLTTTKGGEKLAESEDDLLEHRTDGTDAFDRWISMREVSEGEVSNLSVEMNGTV